MFVCDNKKTKQGNISFRLVPCDVTGREWNDLKNLPRFQEYDLKYVFALESIIPDFDKKRK